MDGFSQLIKKVSTISVFISELLDSNDFLVTAATSAIYDIRFQIQNPKDEPSKAQC